MHYEMHTKTKGCCGGSYSLVGAATASASHLRTHVKAGCVLGLGGQRYAGYRANNESLRFVTLFDAQKDGMN